jgi:integrase
MIRTLSDCGLRIGELFALERCGLDAAAGVVRVEGSAWEGEVTATTEEKNHDRLVPLPAGTLALVRAMPPRIDCPWLFPTKTGKTWRYNNWRRDVWNPAIRAVGTDMRPHEMRHSYVSLVLAGGVDEADLAKITGHSVQTMTGRYRHALERSFDEVRRLVGG